MKTGWMVALMAVFVITMAPTVSEAKRLGGGKSTGMQRAAPERAAPTAPQGGQTPPTAAPNNPAAAAAPTAGAAPAAAPKRSWMGPLAGLAAGVGLAALLGHFGLGGEFANLMMFALLGVVGFVVIRMLMNRFAGGGLRGAQPVPAGVGAGAGTVGMGRVDDAAQLAQRSVWTTAGAAGAGAGAGAGAVPAAPAAASAAVMGPALPAGFDAEGFERIAKTIFVRLQAANDSADLNDLRRFTTPELFAALRVDLLERGASAQQTDVVTVQAQVLECVQETGQQIVSVRFQGLMREEANAAAAPFDEVWHLVKPQDGSREWAIAGIQQPS